MPADILPGIHNTVPHLFRMLSMSRWHYRYLQKYKKKTQHVMTFNILSEVIFHRQNFTLGHIFLNHKNNNFLTKAL
jgi:hypothetical protein